MEEKRLVMVESNNCITYFKLDKSQCDLLKYLDENGYLEYGTNIDFNADIEIVEF